MHETTEWEPYRPAGYPLHDDPFHNPFVTVDPISGATAYAVWKNNPGISPEDFRDMLNAMSPYQD
jgi:hypothetical protein